MTTKQYLDNICKLEWKYKMGMEQYEQLKTMATSMSISLDRENVKSSGSQDKMGTIVSKMADLRTEYNLNYEKRSRMITQFDCLGCSKEYKVLVDTFVFHRNASEIADRLKLGYDRINQLKHNAMRRFEECWGDIYLSVDLDDFDTLDI